MLTVLITVVPLQIRERKQLFGLKADQAADSTRVEENILDQYKQNNTGTYVQEVVSIFNAKMYLSFSGTQSY